MATDFAHLHVHTEYSLLDGYSRIKKLVQQTKAKGMRHLAITDHGSMYGALEFYKACRTEEIHPVIGCEAYLTEDMHDHSKRYSDDYHHLLLLARNNAGYANLMKLVTIANTQGMHLRPRIDKQVLAQHADGLIVTSSCLSGEIPRLLLKGKTKEAYDAANWYRDVFGREHVYLELQEHHGVEDDGQPSQQGKLNQMLYRMHKDLQIPMVATNDLHYIEQGDSHAHDILLCVQTGKQLGTPKRWRFDSHEYYLRSPQEMEQLFHDLPGALANSIIIAEQCDVNPLLYKASIPAYAIPPEYHSQADYLYDLCVRGVRERFGEMSEPIKKRLDYEFNLIVRKGFVNYFLIEWDIVNYCRAHDIRCSARGSAAGSLLAYSLGITNVDPLRYGLPVERFINPDREDMPDIDMDFPDARRKEVIDYVERKYGQACVAQMVTFGTMAAKGSVKDVARVMGKPEVGEAITRAFPRNFKGSLADALASSQDLARLCQTNRSAQEIFTQAQQLEGSVRSTGVHAAGVIIANEPLEHFVPLQLRDPKDPSQGRVTQYEQMHLEELGLIKFDFLGLSNLTTLDTAVKFIEQQHGVRVDLDRLPLDDEKTFALFSKGLTQSVFQFEGEEMTAYLRLLQPTCLEDLMAMVALYRPGPKQSIPDFIDAKHGKKKVTYLDPRLSEWLAESYGIIVYQDQVLLICVNLAGFSWGKVNKFRKALSKKHADEVESYKDDFVKGCIANKVAPDVAQQLFDLILPFGGYGFNKAHAASYAWLAYQSAYIKTNYPAEFTAATLTAEARGANADINVPAVVAESKQLGVRVLGPDVNRSERDFIVENGNVRFGLAAIKGLGEGPANEIVRARNQGKPFASLGDLCARVDQKYVTKSVLECLIKAGAMDGLGERHVLLASIDVALKWAKAERDWSEKGQVGLFGGMEGSESALAFTSVSHAPRISRKQLLAWEKELLRVYFSGHPLEEQAVTLESQVKHTTAQVTESRLNQRMELAGVISEIRRITTKSGDTMCSLVLEDLHGTATVTVFSSLYNQSSKFLVEGALVRVQGRVETYRDKVLVRANAIEPFQMSGTRKSHQPCHVRLKIYVSGTDHRSVSNDTILVQKLYRLLEGNLGTDERPARDTYELLVANGEWEVRLETRRRTLSYTDALHQGLVELLGPDGVEIAVGEQISSSVA